MFSSRAYWGLQFTQIANNWGLFTISTATPTFLTTILHVPLSKVSTGKQPKEPKSKWLKMVLPYFESSWTQMTK